MSDTKGFSIKVYNETSSITISNTCKSGYITFYSDKAGELDISITEEQFVAFAKYLNIEAEKIKKKIEESKGKSGFTVKGDEENG